MYLFPMLKVKNQANFPYGKYIYYTRSSVANAYGKRAQKAYNYPYTVRVSAFVNGL
jgi:hypothetical protein